MAVTPLVIVVWWRRSEAGAGTGTAASAGAFLTGAVVANAAAQVILVAGPLAVEQLGGAATEVSVLFVTLTLFRAPLAIANNLLARLLPPFSAMAAAGEVRALRRWSVQLPLAGVVVGLVAVAAGAWLGPAVTAGLFGGDFRPSATVAALVAGGSVLATVAAFSNQILLALGVTWRLAAAWLAALGAALVTVAVVSADPLTRVAAGFLAGETAALVVVALAAYARLVPDRAVT